MIMTSGFTCLFLILHPRSVEISEISDSPYYAVLEERESQIKQLVGSVRNSKYLDSLSAKKFNFRTLKMQTSIFPQMQNQHLPLPLSPTRT